MGTKASACGTIMSFNYDPAGNWNAIKGHTLLLLHINKSATDHYRTLEEP